MKMGMVLTKFGLIMTKEVEGKLAPQKWVVKYPQGGEGSLNTKQERKKQKKENEETVSENYLGELAPPP